MTDCIHHWLLAEMTVAGTPGTCLKCGAEKNWPRPNYAALADGRPFIMRDPLLARSGINSVGRYKRTSDYY
jgi:hypothetical protein